MFCSWYLPCMKPCFIIHTNDLRHRIIMGKKIFSQHQLRPRVPLISSEWIRALPPPQLWSQTTIFFLSRPVPYHTLLLLQWSRLYNERSSPLDLACPTNEIIATTIDAAIQSTTNNLGTHCIISGFFFKKKISMM